MRPFIVAIAVALFATTLSACATMAVPTAPTPVPSVAASVTQTTAPTPRPMADYLLALNNTWVYEATYYSGYNASDVVTTTSIITERIVEIQTGPDYSAARIQQEYSPEVSSEYWRVVTGDRVYRQEGDLDLSTLRKQGEVELVFPLQLGAEWYQGEGMEKLYPAHDNGSMLWKVTKIGSATVPAGSFDGCYFLEKEIGGVTFENWFCPGVGWVDMKADHHGTPFGSRWVLLRFSTKTASPGRPRETLDRLMQARNGGQDELVLDLLTDELAAHSCDWSAEVWTSATEKRTTCLLTVF
jgi:hypothetical protein